RDEGSAPLHLDDAHPAHVHGRQSGCPTHRRLVVVDRPTGVEDRTPLRNRHLLAVDRQAHEPEVYPLRRHRIPNSIADFTTDDAVCPRPQIEAAFIARSRSSIRSRSTDPFARAIASSTLTVPTRHGTHWPHDSSRKNWAMRRTTSFMSVVALKAMITPDPNVRPAARLSSKVRGMSQ